MNKADIDYIIEKIDSYKPDNIYDGCNSVREKQDQRVSEVLDSLKAEFENDYKNGHTPMPKEWIVSLDLNQTDEIKRHVEERVEKFGKEHLIYNWIKCSDRMPGESKDVLFIRKTWGSNKEICIGHYNSKMKWWQKGSGVIDNESVTHWMSLPEPPEVK